MNISRSALNFFILALLGPLLLLSCSDPQFGARRGQLKEKAPELKTSSSSICSDFTLIRPEVDLLFLWDNSGSSVFLNNQTRQALNRVVENVSGRFDYHIVLAPLLETGSVNSDMKLVTYDTDGLNSSAMAMRIPENQASSSLSFPPGGVSQEAGLKRINSILRANRGNGIFRDGAYTIVVLMSTEDDDSFISGNHAPGNSQRIDYAKEQVHQLMCLRGHYDGRHGSTSCPNNPLESTMMRFLPIVVNDTTRCAQNGIANNTKTGVVYEYASSLVYEEGYNDSSPKRYHTDQSGAPLQQRSSTFNYRLYDSTDICQGDYRGIFDSVNSVIQDQVIAHKYRYWPVGGPNADVDPDTIQVISSNGQELNQLHQSATHPQDNGFKYIGNTTRDTRFHPSFGEPHTGHLIELFGDARVTYPECLRISYTQNQEYYGYVHLTGRPLESSIELKINGVDIPKCPSLNNCSNGWALFNPNNETQLNLKIVSPSNHSPDQDKPDVRTGYFLKLFGSAIYSNGDNVNVNWLPSSSN